jgi:phosphocarrier protein HPr
MIMKEFQYTVKDACGIHARPAGLLVKTVKGFASSATLEKDGKSCDMRKLMALMGMGVKQGDTVTVEGDDEEAAAAAIQKFLTENV